VNPDYNTFGPVLGFAYTPQFGSGWLKDGKTVIRGGFSSVTTTSSTTFL
jgi:hypothetical protein